MTIRPLSRVDKQHGLRLINSDNSSNIQARPHEQDRPEVASDGLNMLTRSLSFNSIIRPTLTVAILVWASLLLPPQSVQAQALETSQTGSAEARNVWMYTVRPGDTLGSITKAYLDSRYSWHQLMHHNHLQSGSDLQVGAVLRIPVDWLRQQPASAMVQQTQGTVRVRRARQSHFQPLKSGQALEIGDEIQTLQGSTKIQFADGSTLRLNENSTLIFNTLTRYGNSGMVDTRTRLLNGSLSTEVKRQQQGDRYEIATPSAVAAVRGTEFRLTTDARSTRAEVTDGVVQLRTDQQTISVAAGYGVSVSGTQVTPPVALLAAPAPDQLPDKIDQLPWTLKWQPISGADHYVAELYQQPEGTLVRNLKLSRASWTFEQLINGSYTLMLRAVDTTGFQGMDFKANLQIDIRSKPAHPISPADQETFEEGHPLFRWQLQQTGDLSRLEIARDPEFAQLVSQTTFTNSTQAAPAQRLTPGRYFWRVTTLAGGSSLSQSSTREIRIHGEMPKTNIIAINYYQDQVKLFWNSLEETNEFVVQVASDPQFNNILREERVSQPYVSIQLPRKTRYYARVKGVAEEFYHSEFSDGREIQLP